MRPTPTPTLIRAPAPEPRGRRPASPTLVPAVLDDQTLLALILERMDPETDSARLAAALLEEFGSLGGVADAAPGDLAQASSVGAVLRAELTLLREFAVRLARAEACRRPVITSWTALVAYVRAALAHEPREQFRTLFLDRRNNDIVETYGQHNTILDNCSVYTAFSALDPLTADKVSKLTGMVMETRTSRSSAAGLGQGRSSVSRSETERPLLEPGEIRALPDDVQLVFVAGRRPLRTTKLKYDRRRPYRKRANLPPPDQSARLDGPPTRPHAWAGVRARGEDPEAQLPLFKEIKAAIDDKKAAAVVTQAMTNVVRQMGAQEAVLDMLQEERTHDKD